MRIERGNYVVCLFDGFRLSEMVCDVSADLIGDCVRSDICIRYCRRLGCCFLGEGWFMFALQPPDSRD